MTRLQKVLETLTKRIDETPSPELLRGIRKSLTSETGTEITARTTTWTIFGYATPEEFEELFGFVMEETKARCANIPVDEKTFCWTLSVDIESPEEEFDEETEEIDDFCHLTYTYDDEDGGIEIDADNTSTTSANHFTRLWVGIHYIKD